MAKTIDFKYGGKEYSLEFSRSTIKALVRKGFALEDIGDTDKMISAIPMFFAGAFAKNHRDIKQSTIDEIWEHITNKTELLTKLAEMYVEPVEVMMDEPDSSSEGNAIWEANW